MPKQNSLQQLNEIVSSFPIVWGKCKSDPADFNNLYTLLGEMLMAITLLTEQITKDSTQSSTDR